MAITAIRLVPDPYLTDAEYFERRRTRTGPNVGKVAAQVNLLEKIGGLARIDSRTELHEEAATKYRNLHDRAQLGGAKAMDYSKQKVDTSGPSESAIAESGATARAGYSSAVRFLGMHRSSIVERVVVYDQSIGNIAGRSARGRARITKELLDALDDLAVHFQLAPRQRR